MCNRPAIDAEKNASQRDKLAAAIKRAEDADKRLCDDSRTIIAAARRHLDTLPKEKAWHIIFFKKDGGGTYRKYSYLTKEGALKDAEYFIRLGHAVSVEELEMGS